MSITDLPERILAAIKHQEICGLYEANVGLLRHCAALRRIVEAHNKPHRCPIPVLNSTAGQLYATEDDGPCWTLIQLADGYDITVDGAA